MILPNTLGIYQFIRNGVYYDYPFEESIESMIPIADQIVICECYSDKDDTWDRLVKIREKYPKITLVRSDWVSRFDGLSNIGNYASTFLNTEWMWQVQSDEVIHEKNYPDLQRLLKSDTLPKDITALRTKYMHFLCNYETEFDFCYKTIIRIARKGYGWKLHGDACQLDRTGFSQKEVLDTDIEVFHYGKVHSGGVGWQKEWDFQQLFKDIGFPDPKMMEMKEKFGEEFCDYVYLFESSIREGKVRKFEGTHPKVMENRIKLFKDNGWEQFVSRMKEGLKI
jgi:hypothetical protein